jgi:DNA-binding CsgD family transcriptional regulator
MENLKIQEAREEVLLQVSTDLDHGRFIVDTNCRVIAFDPVAARFISEAHIWNIVQQSLRVEADGNAMACPQDVMVASGTIYIGMVQSGQSATRWLASSRKVDEFSYEIKIAESRPFDSRRVADLGALYGISRTEMLVVRAIIDGGNTEAISKRMGLSPNTVRTHIKRIHSKLGIHDTAGLVALCLAHSI